MKEGTAVESSNTPKQTRAPIGWLSSILVAVAIAVVVWGLDRLLPSNETGDWVYGGAIILGVSTFSMAILRESLKWIPGLKTLSRLLGNPETRVKLMLFAIMGPLPVLLAADRFASAEVASLAATVFGVYMIGLFILLIASVGFLVVSKTIGWPSRD